MGRLVWTVSCGVASASLDCHLELGFRLADGGREEDGGECQEPEPRVRDGPDANGVRRPEHVGEVQDTEDARGHHAPAMVRVLAHHVGVVDQPVTSHQSTQAQEGEDAVDREDERDAQRHDTGNQGADGLEAVKGSKKHDSSS